MVEDKLPLMSIEEARRLLEYLEDGYVEEANQLIIQAANKAGNELFSELGKMTRNLHDEIANFEVDPRLDEIARFLMQQNVFVIL